jgi:uncharacterized protein DUF6438
MNTMLIVASCFVVTSCSKPKERAVEIRYIPRSSIANEVPYTYKPFYDGGSGYDEKTIRSRLPFEVITISRSPCFGRCPVYEMVLNRDGKAELHARSNMPELGDFTGEIPLYTYGRLCYFIESSGFSEMDRSYTRNATDMATCVVSTRNGATLKEVSDYGSVGPIQLWAIQQLLDAVKDEIQWKSVN